MPHDPRSLARHEARRMGAVLREVGGHGAPFGEGWAACDEPGSWANRAAGLGVYEEVAGETLDALVDFYASQGRPARVQANTYSHPSLFEAMAERGFVCVQRDTMLVHDLRDLPPLSLPSGLQMHRLDPSDPGHIELYRASQFRGFFEDDPVPQSMVGITNRVARHARSTLYWMELDGAVAGSGGLERFEGASALFAGCVHPEARRRGLHGAFIRFRLHEARRQGLDFAMIGSEPAGTTERNALRTGFRPAFAQMSFEKRA